MPEILEKRTRNSKTHSLGGRKFAWDGTIGSIHYEDNGWQNIDNEFLPVSPPWDWEMLKADYHIRVKEDFTAGQILGFFKRGESVFFQPHAFEWTNDLDQIQLISMPQNVTPIITNPVVDLLPAVGVPSHQGSILWPDGYGNGINFKWQCTSTRLVKTLEIENLNNLPIPQQYILDGGNPVLRLNLIFDPPNKNDVDIVIDGQVWNRTSKKQTFNIIEFVKDGEVLWGFMPLRYWDSGDGEGQSVATLEKRGNKFYISIRVPYSWLQTAAYPVFIDTDVDETVVDGYGDAHQLLNGVSFSNAGWYATSYSQETNPRIAGFQWDVVAVPPSADGIIDAYFTGWVYSTSYDDPTLSIYGNDVDNANDFNAEANVASRATTGANEPWEATGIGTGWKVSPSFPGVIQEIVARPGWNEGNNLCILLKGKLEDPIRQVWFYAYDKGSQYAAQLHIEYTEAGGETYNVTAEDGLELADTNLTQAVLNSLSSDGLEIGDTPYKAFAFSLSDGFTLSTWRLGWLSGWRKRIRITIDQGDIDDTLSNFPVLVHLGTSVGRNGDDVSAVFDELAPVNSLADFSSIGGFEGSNPVIPSGAGGEWDEYIGEIGNVLYDPDDAGKEYKMLYTGYEPPYVGDEVYLGYAYSSDGKSWTKHGKVTTFAAEDPYLIKVGETYWIYYEDKEDVPATHINRASSPDCINWTEDAVNNPVIDVGAGASWEEQDVSSPTVWIEDSTWYMLYEGRIADIGKMGLATSPDGYTWTKEGTNPVFIGADTNWDATQVSPDDILKIGSTYYLSYHGYADEWRTGIASSTNLTSWTDGTHNPIYPLVPPTNHIQMFAVSGRYASLYFQGGGSTVGIYFGYLRTNANRKKIAITKADGVTQLYVEIEKWDDANEKAWLHVSRDGWEIASGADTELYLYYDADHADNDSYVGDTNSAPAENVWDTNFKLVYHKGDGVDNANVYDSTDNNNDGAKTGANNPNEVDGQVGRAQDYDGVDDVVIASTIAAITKAGTYTFSAWIKPDATAAAQTIMENVHAANDRNGVNIEAGFLFAGYYNGAAYIGKYGTITTDWSFIVAKNNGGTISLYINNVVQTDSYMANLYSLDRGFRLGLRGDDALDYAGLMDEVRVSDLVRTSAWDKADYESERDDLLAFGSEEKSAPSVLLTIFRSATDGLEIGDAVTIRVILSVLSEDGLTFAGVVTSNAILNALSEDGLTFADVPITQAILGALLEDGFTLADIPSRILIVYRTSSDGLVLADATSAQAVLNSLASDGLELDDLPSSMASLISAVSDGLELGDASSLVHMLNKLASDGFVMGDSPLTQAVLNSLSADGFTLADVPSSRAVLNALSEDGFTLSDAITLLNEINRTATDGLVLGDAVTSQAILNALSEDGFNLADTPTTQAVLGSLAEDGLVLSDLSSIARIVNALASDGIELSDASTTTAILGALVSAGIELSDIPSSTASLFSTSVDELILSDLPALAGIIYNLLAEDGFELSDLPSSIASLFSTIQEGLVLGDTSYRTLWIPKTASDGLILSDLDRIRLIYPRTVTDGLVFADLVEGTVWFCKLIRVSPSRLEIILVPLSRSEVVRLQLSKLPLCRRIRRS